MTMRSGVAQPAADVASLAGKGEGPGGSKRRDVARAARTLTDRVDYFRMRRDSGLGPQDWPEIRARVGSARRGKAPLCRRTLAQNGTGLTGPGGRAFS